MFTGFFLAHPFVTNRITDRCFSHYLCSFLADITFVERVMISFTCLHFYLFQLLWTVSQHLLHGHVALQDCMDSVVYWIKSGWT